VYHVCSRTHPGLNCLDLRILIEPSWLPKVSYPWESSSLPQLVETMLWFLIWMIRGVGAYDPNNLNPTLADPLAAIKCGGPIPLIQYPIHFQQRRLDVSVQLLCAQSQYGGYPSHFNQGGYCSTRSLDGRRIVTFRQQSPDFPISPRYGFICIMVQS
jgi:hypothetical protein